jgi:hypothetical protein
MTLKTKDVLGLAHPKLGANQRLLLMTELEYRESFSGQSCSGTAQSTSLLHIHQAAPSASFFPLPFILLIIPFLPDVFPESNSCRQRHPRFRVINASFICLGSNINMGVREQGCCVHHCWSCNCYHGSWCCILLD